VRILIVDDDPNLRELYATAFAEAGHDAGAVAAAPAAFAALARRDCDVLVLGLRLRRGTGLDVAREVTRLGLPTRIVVISGSADFTRGELMAISPAIAAVLRKPVDLEVMLAEVARLAGR
jgi:DNA-binding NtrC family response regulator